jgi:predicted NBD/HSP70 family sugar kinase
MAVYIGLDIGGTKFMVGAANEHGTVLRRTRADTPLDRDEGVALLHRMIADVAQHEPVTAIGAAIGGPLVAHTGVVSPLHQPQWRDVPLKALMEARWNCLFLVDVDTNVAALGEYAHSAAKVPCLLYITLSTGMGGGFVIDGQIYRGAAGAHPEIGHQSVAYRCRHPERIACECGGGDCLEALVSGNGIRRVYHKPAEQLTEEEWAEVAYNVGQGLRNLAAIYCPDLIVLGGGVAVGGGERLLREAHAVMAAHLRLVPVPTLRLSALGYDTALHGAITMARHST